MITVPCIDVSAQTPSLCACLAEIICIFTHVITRGHFQKRESEIRGSDAVRDETSLSATEETLHWYPNKRGDWAFSSMHLENCKCKQIHDHPQIFDPHCKVNF